MLEQMLYCPRRMQEAQVLYNSRNLERLSATGLYTGEVVKVGNGGIVIPYGNLDLPGIADLHDTFKVDRYGNLYGGHTTAVSKDKGKIRVNTDPLKSRY